MTTESQWRADYYANFDGEHPSRSVLIEAATEDEASAKAVREMGDCSSINLRYATAPMPCTDRALLE